MREPDPIFAHRRLAEIYDVVDGVRRDLDAYVAIVEELGASSILDIGCGTGVLALRLAARGKEVVAIDPAGASLDVARRKPDAARVRWVDGDVAQLPTLAVDVVTMTGNVAQVFLSDLDWHAALRAARGAVLPAGHLVFETRDPSRRCWETWNRAETYRRFDATAAGTVETWVEVTAVELPLVSFRHTFVFADDGTTLVSDSTLRFRARREIIASLADAGFRTREVREAPDRPGLEWVFVATRAGP